MATHETQNRLLCTRGATRAEISYALAEINLEMVHHVVNTIMRMRAPQEKWPSVGMAVQRRECWISATHRFQRKPHKDFDLRCPLST